MKIICNYPAVTSFLKLPRRVNTYKEKNPAADIIRLGIGDVTQPLVPTVIDAFQKAVQEMSNAATFRGYGPEQGYSFLSQKIIEHDYQPRGVELTDDEIFISDGAKCDTGNIQELFSLDNVVAVTDPVYPVYVDSNVMAGRAGKLKENGCFEKIVYLPCTEANGLKPQLPKGGIL